MTWIWRRRVVLSRVPSLKTRLGACRSTPKRCLEQVQRKTYSFLNRRVPLMLIAVGADVEIGFLDLCDIGDQAPARTHVFFFGGEFFVKDEYQRVHEHLQGSPSWLMFSMPRRQPPAALARAATRTWDCYQWNMPRLHVCIFICCFELSLRHHFHCSWILIPVLPGDFIRSS